MTFLDLQNPEKRLMVTSSHGKIINGPAPVHVQSVDSRPLSNFFANTQSCEIH